SSFGDPFLSRSGSIAGSVNNGDDIFALLSSTTSSNDHAKLAVAEELPRPPTPPAFDQFEAGSPARQETNPFAVNAFANDPFAKPVTSSIDLLTAEPATLSAGHNSPLVGDLLDLPNQDPATPTLLDVFATNPQPCYSTPTKPPASSTFLGSTPLPSYASP